LQDARADSFGFGGCHQAFGFGEILIKVTSIGVAQPDDEHALFRR
jgi:hypothetical protein